MAHALGLEAVAEGVETMEQLEALTVLGCDLAQGFNWRRPGAYDDVDAWLTPSATFLGRAGAVPGPHRGGTAVRTLLVDDRGQLGGLPAIAAIRDAAPGAAIVLLTSADHARSPRPSWARPRAARQDPRPRRPRAPPVGSSRGRRLRPGAVVTSILVSGQLGRTVLRVLVGPAPALGRLADRAGQKKRE